MRVVESWTIQHGPAARTIQLLHGDLSRLPGEHAVDVLVVSAFQNDYVPTQSSLIGALYHKSGISVAELERDKRADLREEFSCWLSHPIEGQSFETILCIESGWRGEPPEITDDIFRALSPYILSRSGESSVAMPIIGAGDQGWPVTDMLRQILAAAVAWIRRGLPLSVLKIVTYSGGASLDSARMTFRAVRSETEGLPGPLQADDASSLGGDGDHVFISYAHADADTATRIAENLQASGAGLRVFRDRPNLRPGTSWLLQIAEALDSARRIVALYTPSYWQSTACKDEFAAGLARQIDTGEAVLYPIYFADSRVPYFFRHLHYFDCRDRDTSLLDDACNDLSRAL